jgi:hypothetical protein
MYTLPLHCRSSRKLVHADTTMKVNNRPNLSVFDDNEQLYNKAI